MQVRYSYTDSRVDHGINIQNNMEQEIQLITDVNGQLRIMYVS